MHAKAEALKVFLALPDKVLPLTPAERTKAYKDSEIKVLGKGLAMKVVWDGVVMKKATTTMKIVAYGIEHRPMVEVEYTWTNLGMIARQHTYVYHLKRLKNGWDVKRVK